MPVTSGQGRAAPHRLAPLCDRLTTEGSGCFYLYPARLTELPSVNIRIFPLGAGTHPGLNGSFNVISFAAAGAMDVVYVEAPFAQRWVEGGEAAAAYDEPFEKIAERSLSERESVSFLHKLRKEL